MVFYIVIMGIIELSVSQMLIRQNLRSTGGPLQVTVSLLIENLVSWNSKKHNVVSRSSAESEYKAMAQSVCEIIWISQLLMEVGIKTSILAKLWCDNQAALHIASNPVFHEWTKHIEIDCHFVRDKIQLGLISIGYVKTGERLGDIFHKSPKWGLSYLSLEHVGV